MSEDKDRAITLSREDFYELVWSKPMRDLAKDFDISDVALAKRCRGLSIPIPGRGYWARIDAGQKPYRPKLSTREPKWSDSNALTVARSPYAAPAPSVVPTPADDKIWLEDKLAFEKRAENCIIVPTTQKKWHAAIDACRKDLEEAAEKLLESHAAQESYERLPEQVVA